MYKIKNLVIDKLTYVYILYVNFISVALITEKLMAIKRNKSTGPINKWKGGG